MNYLNFSPLSCSCFQKSEAAVRNVLRNRCSETFRNIQRKRPALESAFNKVADLQIYVKIFKNSFFHKTPPVAVSEKFTNLPG